MSASNRASLIGKLHTALKKYYKPLPAQPTRPLLEHVLYASLLEDAPADLADEGMAKCEQEFFDWNEVRVTTVTELAQVLSNLPDPQKAARRLKSNLQAIFEEFYTFDLDHLKKENLGKAVGKFEKMPGMTPFVLNYTIQHGLGGHAIPVDYSAMVIMLSTEIASQSEAMAGKVPGLERAIAKSKGIEFAGLLHQAAVALNKNTKDKTARQLLDAVSKGSSKRLDEWLASKKAAKKRVVKRKAEERAAAAEAEQEASEPQVTGKQVKAKGSAQTTAAAKKKAKKETPAQPTKAEAKLENQPAAKKKKSKKATPTKAAATKKTTKKKTKSAASKPAKKATKKSPSRKLSKRKPR
jgi:endonuclease-3